MTQASMIHTPADDGAAQVAGGKGAAHNLAAFGVRLGAYATFAAILGYFALFAPGFLSIFNIINVVEQSAILGVLAYGMTVVIIAGGSNVTEGGIDLSIAATAGLCAAVYASMIKAGCSDVLGVGAALSTGLAVGALNALAVVGFGILPLLGTLAVMNVVAGVELTFTQNTVISATSPLTGVLISGSLFGVSAMAWCLIVVSLAMALFVHKTAFGLRLYAVGGHSEAARAAGVNVPFYIVFSYLFSGFLAAVAAVLMVSRLSGSSPGAGDMLLSVLAGALLGAVFSRRFVPTIGGTLLSVLFIGFLSNAFQLLNVSSYWVNGVQGAMILLVVAATSFARSPEGVR